MNTNQDPGAAGVGPAQKLNPAGKIVAQMIELPGAIARLMADPQIPAHSHFKQNVAEARARIDWLGLR